MARRIDYTGYENRFIKVIDESKVDIQEEKTKIKRLKRVFGNVYVKNVIRHFMLLHQIFLIQNLVVAQEDIKM